MASCMMHLSVGRDFLLTKEGCLDPAQFYLGCIAPDCVNVDCFAPKKKRWSTHLRASDLQAWCQNISDFCFRTLHNNSSGSVDLLYGYCIHLITDVAWDESFHNNIWSEMDCMHLPSMMGASAGWEDCFRYDYDMLRSDWWQEEVCPALKRSVPIKMNNIGKELLRRYCSFVCESYRDTIPQGNPYLVTKALVAQLSEVVLCKAEVLLPPLQQKVERHASGTV